MRRFFQAWICWLWLAAGVACSAPQRAQAFGGVWPSAGARVEQAAQRVILVRGSERRVTAILQLELEGDASRFAWLVPVPSQARVSVSSSTVFERLETVSAPQYWVEQSGVHDCKASPSPNLDTAREPTVSAIRVVRRGSVGPFDYVDLTVDPSEPDIRPVTDWLAREGFEARGDEDERLGRYLRDGWHLLAFRLSPGAGVRELRPIQLDYESDQLVLPLAAAAGTRELDLQLWIFAPSQAVPSNYASLVLNDARIDWLSAGKFAAGNLPSGGGGLLAGYVPRPSNYTEVVSAAAREADGRGFVTELADAASDYRERVWSAADEGNFEIASTQPYADGVDALWQVGTQYGGWDGLYEAIEGATSLPAGVSLTMLLADPRAYRGRAQVDIPVLMQRVREHVIEPMRQAARALQLAPYLTRLYTHLDASALAEDARFDLNYDLAQVRGVHVARQTLACSAGEQADAVDWQIRLPQGGLRSGSGLRWPDAGDLPANLKVVKLSEHGAGEVLQDNSQRLAAALLPPSAASEEPSSAQPPQNAASIGGSQRLMLPFEPLPPAAEHGPGCGVANVSAAHGGWGPLVLAVLLGLRRRPRAALAWVTVAALAGCSEDDAPRLRDSASALGNLDMTQEQLRDPETCKGCHPAHYREWSASMHAYAARDPVFVAMNERGQRETGGALGDFCVRCHAPMAVLDKRTTNGLNLSELPDHDRGVSCYFCHNATSIEGDHNGLIGIARDSIMRGPIKDPVQPGVHGAQYSELFDDATPKSSAMCGGCHDIVMPSGVHLERTFEEFRFGLFSKTAAGDPSEAQPEFGSCVGCHMPVRAEQAAVAPAGTPQRIVHEHLWPGVDLALTDFPHKDAMRSAVEDCQLGAASLSFFKLEVTPPDLFTFQLETNAGHNQPSGAAEDRRLWLEFAAYDESGQLLQDQSSGLIEDGQPEDFAETDPRHDPRLLMFRDKLFDARGKEVHMFWDAARSREHPQGYESSALPVATSTYVEGKHTLVKQYRASGPNGLPARVTARLRMRPIGHDVLQDLIESGDLDPAVANKLQTLDFGTQLEWTQADGVHKLISATPASDCSSYRCLLDPSSVGCAKVD